jgi:hypothetical protein
MNKKQILIDRNNTQNDDNTILPLGKKENFNEPFIFKLNKKESPIKTIKYINNDTGRIRHFTPAAQEWFNSIYNYNKNYIKSLPAADKNVIKLLKGYFNLTVKNNKKINKKKKIKRMPYKLRKLSTNKVFVGKGDLKHTNKKVIITSYVYNAEQFYLKNRVKELYDDLYSPRIKNLNLNFTRFDITNNKRIFDYNRPHTLDEFLNYPTHYTHKINFPEHSSWHKNVCFRLFWKKYVKLIGQKKILSLDLATRKKVSKRNKYLKKGKNKKIFTSFKDKTKNTFFQAFLENISNDQILAKFSSTIAELVDKNEANDKKVLNFEHEINIINNFYNNFEAYIDLAKIFRIKSYKKYRYLLMVNIAKFEKPFIQKLVDLVKNIYHKNVEFNLVNLYKMHLNSDIYTQSVSLKLKNRNNKLFKVLTRSLTKAKLPNVNRSNDRYHKENRNEYLINKIRNTYINSMLLGSTNDNSVDPLNNLLVGFFPLSKKLEIEVRKRSSIIKRSVSLYKYIISTLKHIRLAGIRVEAKGRLTRRFTASRSVFRVKWKGGLENVDSSFKGLSAIMLRGDRKSNVQYSISNSKNRNGAFGVKGWVGSK